MDDGFNDNRVTVLMDTELLDRLQLTREIHARLIDGMLREALGDLDNWRPVGILSRERLAEIFDVPPEALEGPEDRNARAVAWWRSQRPRRRMTLTEAMDKIRTEFGGALDQLGRS
jgi:hypothetical protein